MSAVFHLGPASANTLCGNGAQGERSERCKGLLAINSSFCMLNLFFAGLLCGMLYLHNTEIS